MESDTLIRNAQSQNRSCLTEAESKMLLAEYGIPVVEESVVTSENAAVEFAEKTGYPVVLKGVGMQLTHKTEKGLVFIDLRTPEDVRQAFRKAQERAGMELEGCLVQPMIKGKREFVTGLFQDPQFGPVVMFGLGGIFTEVLEDVVFRVAPVSREEADRMMDSLQGAKMLSDFRGESAADREALIRTLTGLSQLGLAHPEISEIDINPLIVSPDGHLTAVDALVILQSNEKTSQTVQTNPTETRLSSIDGPSVVDDLHALYHPESIAILGASGDKNKLGYMLALGYMEMGYAGKLYFVNPSGAGTIFNQPVYKSIEDIPGEIVMAVICTPPSALPGLLEQCAKKSVRGITLFVTPADNDQPELLKAVELVRSKGIRMIGPNSMGLHCPSSGLAFWPFLSKRTGPVSCIAHSGGMSFGILTAIEARGIGSSKTVSVGNEWDLNWTDFLEYFGHDDETEIITGYLEGMADGRRFLEVASGIGGKKPFICVKGGDSSVGNQFAGSHTGGMAGSRRIWKAAFDQANVVKALDLQDLLNHVVMFHYLKDRPLGRRIGIVTGTGGPTVVTADLCEQYGLQIPELSESTKEEVKKILPPFGTSCRNPVDVSIAAAVIPSLYSRGINILDQSDDVDIILAIHTGDSVGEEVATEIIRENSNCVKPLIVLMVGSSEKNFRPVKMLLDAGIASFETQEGTVRALSSVIRWKERAEQMKVETP